MIFKSGKKNTKKKKLEQRNLLKKLVFFLRLETSEEI